MKSQDIDNLYKSLTSHERAAMSFKAMCHQDSDTQNKLIAATPRFTYSQPDNDYTSRINSIFEIASMWSIEYWKHYCQMIAAISLSANTSRFKDEKRSERIDDLHYEHKSRLIALFMILDSLKDSHMVDKQSVLMFADIAANFSDQCPFEQLTENAQAYHNNWLAFFTSLLEGTEVDLNVQHYFGLVDEAEVNH